MTKPSVGEKEMLVALEAMYFAWFSAGPYMPTEGYHKEAYDAIRALIEKGQPKVSKPCKHQWEKHSTDWHDVHWCPICGAIQFRDEQERRHTRFVQYKAGARPSSPSAKGE